MTDSDGVLPIKPPHHKRRSPSEPLSQKTFAGPLPAGLGTGAGTFGRPGAGSRQIYGQLELDGSGRHALPMSYPILYILDIIPDIKPDTVPDIAPGV